MFLKYNIKSDYNISFVFKTYFRLKYKSVTLKVVSLWNIKLHYQLSLWFLLVALTTPRFKCNMQYNRLFKYSNCNTAALAGYFGYYWWKKISLGVKDNCVVQYGQFNSLLNLFRVRKFKSLDRIRLFHTITLNSFKYEFYPELWIFTNYVFHGRFVHSQSQLDFRINICFINLIC